jgi:hypothetical protein
MKRADEMLNYFRESSIQNCGAKGSARLIMFLLLQQCE